MHDDQGIDAREIDLANVPRQMLEDVLRSCLDLSGYEVPHSDTNFFIIKRESYWKLHAQCCVALERCGLQPDGSFHLQRMAPSTPAPETPAKDGVLKPVEAIFHEAVRQGSKTNDVVDRLNRIGIKTRRGNDWSYMTVYCRLQETSEKMRKEQAIREHEARS